MTVVALAILLTGLGIVVLSSVAAPYDQAFDDLRGAHIWLYVSPNPPEEMLTTLTNAPNILEVGELEEVASGSIVVNAGKLPAMMQSYPLTSPSLGRITITEGYGLSEDDPDGIVLDHAFADAYHLQTGDVLAIVTSAGLVQTHIRGLSVDVNHNIVHDGRTAHVFALHKTLDHWFPNPTNREGIIGLRLVHPYEASTTANDLVQRLRSQGISASFRQDDWLSYRNSYLAAFQFTATLLLAFGIGCLLASGIIVANLITGQVLAQRRDTGILKAIGFTPGQTVFVLVAEYLLIGALGGAIGLVLAISASPLLLERLGASTGIGVTPHVSIASLALLFVAILIVIALSAALPAWRAGSMRTADALRAEDAAPSKIRVLSTKLVHFFKLPPVGDLGLQSITIRPLRALLVMLTLLVAVVAGVFGVGLLAALNAYQGGTSSYSDVHIGPGLYDPAATQQLVSMRPEIVSYYTTVAGTATLPDNGDRQVNISAIAGATDRIAAAVSEGRWFRSNADEAVINGAISDLLHLRVGDRLLLSLRNSSGAAATVNLTVVGVLRSISGASLVYVPQQRYVAALAITPAQLLAATSYEASLRSGASPQAFTRTLLDLTAYQIDTTVSSKSLPSIIKQLPPLVFTLCAALMLIGGISVLNAMALSIRERYHELGVLKSIGFSPRQVLASVLISAITMAAMALLVGIPLGLWCTDIGLTIAARSQGISSLMIPVDWPGLAILILTLCMLAALGAWIPARRAANLSPALVLREE